VNHSLTASRERPALFSEAAAIDSIIVAIGLIAVTALAAGLRLYNLGAVPMNAFYDASVLSMSHSWHNFFFAAFEPGGSVAIDKPPFELWLQVIAIKILGFNSFALKLPEALAGTLAVPLLFDAVRRVFGSGAGLLSAAVLAVLPISVITSRSDTMDSLMMLLLVLTVWLLTLAMQRRSLVFLALAAVVIGVNFDVKLIEALLPVFAFLVYFMVGSDATFPRKLALVAGAAAIALVAGLAWPVAVSLAPASQRPYAMGSTNGSIWNAMFVFNGTKRVGIGSSGDAQANNWHSVRAATRMFQHRPRQLGELVGVGLIAALLFGIASLVLMGGSMLRGPPSDELRMRRAGVAMIITWLITVSFALSVSTRLHPRYIESLTPAIAMALGISIAWLTRATRRKPLQAAAAIAICCIGTIYFVATLQTTKHALIIAMVLTACAAVALALTRAIEPARRRSASISRNVRIAIAALILCTVLASPLAVSQRLAAASYSDSSYGPTDITKRQAEHYASFFAAHRGNARYQAVVRTPSQASALVVHNGLPVMLLQTVGRGEILSLPAMQRAIATGQVKYALLGQHCSGTHLRRFCPSTARWIQTHELLIKRSVGLYALGGATQKGANSGHR
jgi:4-amino-4-deoxy-L-arabinose transferase-like glycosyltransferase